MGLARKDCCTLTGVAICSRPVMTRTMVALGSIICVRNVTSNRNYCSMVCVGK